MSCQDTGGMLISLAVIHSDFTFISLLWKLVHIKKGVLVCVGIKVIALIKTI